MQNGKRSLIGLAVALVACALHGPAAAQDKWPSKPIQLVVPFAAGGSTDLVARRLAAAVGKRLNASVFVENKTGAGGVIGTGFVARQPADGYTLLMGTISTHAMAPSVFAKLPYDIEKDFTPITTVGTIPDLIVVRPGLGINTLAEFIALAKSKPGQITYASGGPGPSSNFGAEYFASEAGINLNHIPYRGSGPALLDVLAGNVDMMLDVIMTSMEPLKAGKLKPLAVTSRKRSPMVPDVPTVIESGIPDFEAVIWFAIFAPPKMPVELQARIAEAFDAAINEPDMKSFLQTAAIDPSGTGPKALADLVKSEIPKWARIAKIANFKPQ